MPLPTTTTFSAPETSAVRRTYEIGGFRVRVDSFPFHESAFLAAFRTDDRRDPELCLTVRALPEIPAEAGIIPAPAGETVFRDGAGRRVRLRRKESGEALLYRVTETGPDALLAELAADAAPGLGSGLILRWLELPARLLARDALFLHASFVGLGERAILFTGPKQIGKSTQAELWRRCRGARVLNGDRALLRLLEGRWTACGSPYCGTSGICVNASLPLGALVLLEQGPENRVEPAAPRRVMSAFLSGCSYDPGDPAAAALVLDLAAALSREVPVLRLVCRPDEGAVRCLEEALRKEGVCV